MPSPDAARRLRELLMESSPLIEEYTSRVCPACTDVCCRQRHGRYLEGDIRYLSALGVAIPESSVSGPPDGPCGFLGPSGCVQPRWLRPWKCTWYFCDPLLRAVESGPAKQARDLSRMLQEMIALYDQVRSGSRKLD